MRLLIGGSSSKIFHLKDFQDALVKLGVECKLVIDTDICNGFPSRKISDWFQTQKKFDELISDFKPDVVFVDRQLHFTLSSIQAKLPTFIQLRGDYWAEKEWFNQTVKNPVQRLTGFLKNKISANCFKNTTAIIPLCKYLEKIVEENHPDTKTHILQSGIAPERWYPSKGMQLKHPCVGLLQGAVIWGKAQEMLVLQKVLESMPDVMFYWVGDGPYRDKILPVLEKHDNFKWLGPLQYPDKVREYLTEIDVYALVSGIDMSPLTLQEAQLMKKPVVATDVGGIPELMKDNETGFLVEKGNSKEWIEKLSLLINDKEKRNEMGNNGRKFVEENFSWDKIAKEFLKILREEGIKS